MWITIFVRDKAYLFIFKGLKDPRKKQIKLTLLMFISEKVMIPGFASMESVQLIFMWRFSQAGILGWYRYECLYDQFEDNTF